MSNNQKLFLQYDQNEIELKNKLLKELPQTINGKNDLLFCSESINPYSELKYHISGKGTQIYQFALDNIKLAKQLKIDNSNSISFLTKKYFDMWSDVENHHRGNSSSIAQLLLDEINGLS